jgi:hypothetical protein
MGLLICVDGANRIVNLVTGEPAPAADGAWWWRAVLVAIGVCAAGAAVGVAVWRVRTSDFDAPERAFRALARRRGLGAGARDAVRRAAGLSGCAPVALLVSRHAMGAAVERVRAADQQTIRAAEPVRGPVNPGAGRRL